MSCQRKEGDIGYGCADVVVEILLKYLLPASQVVSQDRAVV